MSAETRRYKATIKESNKERQLSSLFNIIANNILIATEVLSTNYKIEAIQKLELLSKKARQFSKELISDSKNISKDDLFEKISLLKRQMLELILDLTDELGKLDTSKKSDIKNMENIILARRLLRESQRGLITIQD